MSSESDFIEVPELHRNSDEEGRFKILFPRDGFVLAEGEPINLCGMCQKNRSTCENPLPRMVRVPISQDTITTPQAVGNKFKFVDGIAEGIITEAQTGSVSICKWFQPKELG